MATLHIFRQDHEVLRIPLTTYPVHLGRHPSNDLMFPDEAISRSHAVIEKNEVGVWIVDVSRNGTKLNGKRIDRALLRNGDQIQIGTWVLHFLESDPEPDNETLIGKKRRVPQGFCGMIGDSEGMRRVYDMIRKSAPSMATILILGETGSGKELVARSVHETSPRSRKPFIAINCGAISPHLIESELFGHEKGAFTGAVGRHLGAFEQAQGGTLFLDEIGELPLDLQPKLLRVLEEKRVRRVGGLQEIPVDVRVVAATHRDLEERVKDGKFREDLFFRLFSVPLLLPSLRERREDIPIMVEYFSKSLGNEDKSFSDEAIAVMKDHYWKGNVRELKNVITRSLLFSTSSVLGPGDILFFHETQEVPKVTLKDFERDAILSALKENGWNKKQTAIRLGIAKSTLFQKLKDYGITGAER